MGALTIVSLNYSGSRMEEIADTVVSAYAPVITDYRICDVSEEGLLDEVSLHITDPAWPERMIMNTAVHKAFSAYERPLIALTSERLLWDIHPTYHPGTGIGQYVLDEDNWLMHIPPQLYGSASSVHGSAVVSSCDSEFGRSDTQEHVERVSLLGIHELGHLMGLGHHYQEPHLTQNSKLCAMSSAHPELLGADTHGNEALFMNGSVEEYLTRRDTALCQQCYEAVLNNHGS